MSVPASQEGAWDHLPLGGADPELQGLRPAPPLAHRQARTAHVVTRARFASLARLLPRPRNRGMPSKPADVLYHRFSA